MSRWFSVGNVVGDRVIKQNRILRHYPYRPTQRRLRHIAHILPVYQDRTLIYIIETE